MVLREDLYIGDQVGFWFKGKNFEGLVSAVNQRVTVIVPLHGKFYIPLHMITLIRGRRMNRTVEVIDNLFAERS